MDQRSGMESRPVSFFVETPVSDHRAIFSEF